MSYGTWSVIMIVLLIIGVGGLIATIALDISTSWSTRSLNLVRGVLVLAGVLGAIGIGALAFGVFPFGHYEGPVTTGTGINATNPSGVMTQGSSHTATQGQGQ